jgi:hypothetical protein
MIGALPTDLGSRFYLEAERGGRLGEVAWTFSTRLTVASGRPRDVLVDGDDGLEYVIRRGAAGREPVLSQANVRLAASWRGFELAVDVLNVFDRRTETFTDPLYAVGSFRPIEGGSYADLVFLRDDDGALPQRQTTHELATQFQPPLEAFVELRRAL